MCLNISSSQFEAAFVRNVFSTTPVIVSPAFLDGVTMLNAQEVQVYDDFLYVLSAPASPSEGKPGVLLAYSLEINGFQAIVNPVAAFGPAYFNISTDFSVSSFLILSTETPALSQMFLLDGFGRGIIYSTYDSHFVSSPLLYAWSVWDIQHDLREQMVYLPLNTRYLSLEVSSQPFPSEKTVTYSVVLVTDITPVYEFTLTFAIGELESPRPLV